VSFFVFVFVFININSYYCITFKQIADIIWNLNAMEDSYKNIHILG